MSKVELKKNTTGRPSTDSFDIIVDGNVVGFCQLRHIPRRSDDVPPNFESHIYYEILPEERGKGYAKEAVRLMVAKAKEAGLREVIIVISEDNIPSRKVAEANGAKLIEERDGSNTKSYGKYLIKLK